MTSLRRPGCLTRVGAWLLAVLAAVGLLVFGAGTASAAPLPDIGNRVRASAPETITAVGVSEHITAGQGRGPPALQGRFVVATGVAANSVAKFDADFAIGQLTRGGQGRASQLVDFGESQGWKRVQNPGGPIKYVDEGGVSRLTIKQGSARTPGSESPHVEIRDATGQRVDPYGNAVTRRSAGNHTPIDWDLP